MSYVCSMNDQKFMQRALDLAGRGLGKVSPNPMVGCVIVHKNNIIGEGWHREFGGPHAEVMAVEAVTDKALLVESVVYVTLEPCSYHGKTPACTDLLVKIKPARVVVASLDPNPKVSGRGLKILRAAGIEVDFGLLQEKAVALNKRFFVNMHQKRPYIILKWAQTADGFLARTNYDSRWISNALSRQLVHQWRAMEDGILVGFNTVKYDDPALTVRNWHGRNPLRIVLDPKKQLAVKSKVFDDKVKTYWLNTVENSSRNNLIVHRLPEANTLSAGLQYLYEENIGSIIVEGGAATLGQLLLAGLWDEARIFVSPQLFEEGLKAPVIDLPAASEQFIEEDRLSTIFNPETQKIWQKN